MCDKIADGLKREKRKVMKKIVIFITLILALIMCITSCNKKQNTDQNSEHTHEFSEWFITQNATCSNDGVQVRYCACGEKQNETVPKLSHKVVIDAVVDPTCTKIGLTEGKHCSECNEILVVQNIVDALGHTETAATIENNVAPSCTVAGSYNSVIYCSACGDELSRTLVVIPALGHTAAVDEAISPTCTKNGLTEGKHCSVCSETLIAQQEVPKTAHTYDDKYDESCNKCGFIRDAECAHTETEVIKGFDSTCTYTGLSDGTKCVKCEEILIPQTEIPTKEHTKSEAVKEGWINPTCTIAGSYDSVIYCTFCRYELSRDTITVDATGHTEAETVIENKIEATCTAEGSYDSVIYCLYCEIELSRETITVKKVDHDYVDGYCKGCFDPKPSEGLTYKLNSDGVSYSVTGIGTCTDTDIIIPDTYENLPVITISQQAFKKCSNLVSITIPDSVTSIWNSAFEGCLSLASIIVDGDNAQFESIDGNLYTKYGKTLIQYAIGKTDSSFTIPDGVTSISGGAFEGCSNLTSVTIADSVKTIGSMAFEGCSNITNVYISDIATWCGISFNDFSSNPLRYAKNLYLIGDGEAKLASNIVIPDGIVKINNFAFYGCTSITDVTIGNDVTSIGNYAFLYCSSLAHITIPESVKTIGYEAFEFCSSLTIITIPNSVTSIGNGTFNGCSSLTTITIPNSVTSIGGGAFERCSSLVSINIPDRVTSIGSSTFKGCSNLTSITIPDRVTSIGTSAFLGCKSLTSITIPDSVITIDKEAFRDCTRLEYVSFGEKSRLTTIGTSAFSFCKLTNIVIPNSVTIISDYAFYVCHGLKSVTIGNSVTNIGEYAFSDCQKLTNVNIPDSVISIGSYAFGSCSSLTNISLGKGIESISSNAFYSCSSLYAIYDNSSLNLEIGSKDNGYVAYHAIVIINNGVATYSRENCILTDDYFLFQYSTYKGTYYYELIAYCGNEETVTLPKSINDFKYTIFYMQGLINVIIPDNITSINDNAFTGCYSLTNITIPNSVTSIGNYAFRNCLSITNITIPDTVTSIGSYAFMGCSSLVSINIPENVTSIGDSTFEGCSDLVNINIPYNVSSIGTSAFERCSSLVSINIPNSVTSIGDDAFYGCVNLESINYDGTIDKWDSIEKGSSWNSATGNYTIYCTDGEIAKDGTVTYY